MKMTKDVRIHLIGGESVDVDCSNFTGETLDAFLDSVIYELLDQEYIRINHLVIPANSVLYVECLEAECDCNVMNIAKHIEFDDVGFYVDSERVGTIVVDEINRLLKAPLIEI